MNEIIIIEKGYYYLIRHFHKFTSIVVWLNSFLVTILCVRVKLSKTFNYVLETFKLSF